MSTDQLLTLALLGVFHGINPGMGWLFAVSIGMQERSRKALLLALPAIALGHEAAIGVMVLVLTVTSSPRSSSFSSAAAFCSRSASGSCGPNAICAGSACG